MILSRSPDAGKFSRQRYEKKVEVDPTDQSSIDMIDWLDSFEQQQRDRELSVEWQTNNLEYDLRSTDWIVDKVRASDVYAQNLYAALCNNEFYKLSDDEKELTIQILKEDFPTWSCSWRYAGGIVANMKAKGDYIDWYCSGIRGHDSDVNVDELTDEQLEYYNESKAYVSESIVTSEIASDFRKLGWIVKDEQTDIISI